MKLWIWSNLKKRSFFPHNESRVIRFNTVMSYKLPWNCELTTCQLGFSRYDSKGETQKGYIKKKKKKCGFT